MAIINYSGWQKAWLVVLRFIIGWQFMYEGVVKLANPDWTSTGYLMDSQGFLKGFYYWMANNSIVLNTVDILNMWGLIAIGLGLILGLFTRVAIIAAIVLLGLYYMSHPPFIGLKYAFPSGGSYLFVNNIIIELFALIVLYVFPTEREYGIDRFILGSNK